MVRRAAVVLFALAGCDPAPDTFALRNGTNEPLFVQIQTSRPFVSDDCDSHADNVELGMAGETSIGIGRRRCFQPGDGPGDSSDARLAVVRLVVISQSMP